jgi:hypothetical protein
MMPVPAAVRPEALAPLLAAGLGVQTAARVLASAGCARRLPGVLRERLGDAAPALAALPRQEAALAVAQPGTIARAITLAGAVWHGARVRALVLAADVASFVAVHGAAARAVAFAHAALSQPSDDRPLAAAIAADGALVMEAWRRALPAPLPEWLALCIAPPAETPSPAHVQHGPAIVRAIAGQAIA